MHSHAQIPRIINPHTLSETFKKHPGEPFLPLSWSVQKQYQHPIIQKVSLRVSKSKWLAFADVPQHYTPEKLSLWLHQHQQARPYLIRGCHPLFIQHLEKHGGQAILTGREALLDLHQTHLERKSLKELARRGKRKAEIIEINSQDLWHSLKDLEGFIQEVQRNYSAPLSYLYRTHLPASERFWVLKSERIQGLVSLIPTGPKSWHTELLLRAPNAPVGTIEALIQHIFLSLKSEGAHYWSLGEIPFHPPVPPRGLKSIALTEIGRKIDFAYSSSGLLNFKQKFQPLWRPVYLFGWPNLTWTSLAAMFWKSNCHKMILSELLKKHSRRI